MKQRLIQFDIAKALCIILVAIGHYVPEGMPGWYKLVHDWIYSFHMPLFMFASGYIYIAYKRDEGYCKFIWKKIKRLMLPYFTTSAIVITIKLLTQRGMYVENPVSVFSFVKMFYLPEAGYFLWFIWALFLMFCVVPFFKNKWSRVGLFTFALIWHIYHPISLTHVFCINQAAGMLVWFMFGVVCFDWKGLIAKITGKKSFYGIISGLMLVCFCLFSVLKFVFQVYVAYFASMATYLLPWFGIGSVIVISTWLTSQAEYKWIKLLLMVGASSYIVYLFHTTFMGFAKGIIYKVHFLDKGNDLIFSLCVLLVVCCGVIFPVLLHKFILKRYKITRVLFGLK